MTRRARNVVIANNDFVPKAGTVLTSPTAFVAGMGLANISSDRLKMVCRTIGNSVILDLDMGYPVPASLFMLLGHNLTASARWRIRGARARSGTASAAGGYTFALSDTVYDTRSVLATGTARGAYTWTGAMLDHDFTAGTLPAGASFGRAGPATYWDHTGTLRTAAAGEPRFDYDPVAKVARGILMDEIRVNLLPRSQEFGDPLWNKSNVSVASNVAIAPDGTMTADEITSSSTPHDVYANSVTVSAGSVTCSVFAKAGTSAHLFMREPSAASTISVFSLSGAGSVVSTSGTTGAGIQSIGSGWYRCWQTYTAAAGFANPALRICDAGGNLVVGSVVIWGAQLESGAFPTSYVPTTSATVTRLADVATIATSALPSFSEFAGTIVLTYRVPATTGTIPAITLDDGTANERIRFVVDAGTMKAQVVDGGVTQADISLGSVTAGTEYIVAVAWAANEISACMNGGSVGTDTSASLPTVTTLTCGAGWHSRLTYIASRVSNADLQTLSNPATSAATRAATLAPYAGTSGTAPITLGMGSQTVYVDDAGLRFYRGTSVRLAIDATRYMSGTVTAYDRPSRRLTVNVTAVVGGGSAATVTILREASDLSVWPSVDPFGLSYWGAFTWGGQIDLLGEGYQPPGVHLPGLANGDGQPIYARYFKIEVQDTSLSWLDIGRLVVAAAYQPTINMQWDWRLSWVDPSTRERSRGGQLYVDGRKQWRAASLSLANIGRDEMLSQMYELRRAVGVRKPFALILDPTDPVNLHRLTLWGSMPDQTVDFSNPQYADYRTTLTVEESF